MRCRIWRRLAGVNFDPQVATYIIDFMNKGKWDEYLLVENEETGDKIHLPSFYPRDVLKRFLDANRELLLERFDMEVDSSITKLKKVSEDPDVPDDLLLSDAAIKFDIMSLFIKITGSDRRDSVKLHSHKVDECFEMFKDTLPAGCE